jgi:hypothetical protein
MFGLLVTAGLFVAYFGAFGELGRIIREHKKTKMKREGE